MVQTVYILTALVAVFDFVVAAQTVTSVTPSRKSPPSQFAVPKSEAYDYVNPLIGNGGDTPNGSGGMIPSTGPPFPMVRWVAQTNWNYVSKTPYNWTSKTIHGFQGTRQPAIWMGESGPVAVVPGFVPVSVGVNEENAKLGNRVKTDFDQRGLKKVDGTEVITPAYYAIELEDDIGRGGRVLVEQSSTSRVGHLRFTFKPSSPSFAPSLLVEVARPSVITSTPTNITYPNGEVTISPLSSSASSSVLEISGFTDERQDRIITPYSIAENANKFKGYFYAQITTQASPLRPSTLDFGIAQNGTIHTQALSGSGPLLSAYTIFSSRPGSKEDAEIIIDVRIGTSLISESTARSHIASEIPPESSLEDTARKVREEWIEKLGRIEIEGGAEDQKEIFYTSVYHALTYPNEQIENGMYWSGYDGTVHEASESYTGYSIWDTFRAGWGWLILMAPERVPGMITSMLADYKESGWLPMWKNIVETNIMIGTHADSLIAEAVVKGVSGFDRDLAWEAVWKDATVAPKDDGTVRYGDREENVDFEVRAGLSSVYDVPGKGWVADDLHSESASRTLDYAYGDYAAAKLGWALGKPEETVNFLLQRSLDAPFSIWNSETKFMEARNADGSFAGQDVGWTEGDMWAYSFDVIHDVPRLIKERGGNSSFVKSLDDHFDGGHNDHANEPSHHIPYLYALAGAAYKTQERVRQIATTDYNATANGLSGNEDCGQMSAWYVFTAMGFYPVNPASGEYVVGSPFFDKLSITLPAIPNGREERRLTIVAQGAQTKPYVKSLTINGEMATWPVIRHDQIVDGGHIVFEMSEKPEKWGNGLLWTGERHHVEL